MEIAKKDRTMKVRNPPTDMKNKVKVEDHLGQKYKDRLYKSKSPLKDRKESDRVHAGERLYQQSIRFNPKDIELYI